MKKVILLFLIFNSDSTYCQELVKNFNNFQIDNIIEYKGKIALSERTTADSQPNLWLSDGSLEGTIKVKNNIGLVLNKLNNNLIVEGSFQKILAFEDVNQNIDTLINFYNVYKKVNFCHDTTPCDFVDSENKLNSIYYLTKFVDFPTSDCRLKLFISNGTSSGTTSQNINSCGDYSSYKTVGGNEIFLSKDIINTNTRKLSKFVRIDENGINEIFTIADVSITILSNGAYKPSGYYYYQGTPRAVLKDIYWNGHKVTYKTEGGYFNSDFGLYKNGILLSENNEAAIVTSVEDILILRESTYQGENIICTKGQELNSIKNFKKYKFSESFKHKIKEEIYFYAEDYAGNNGLWKTNGINAEFIKSIPFNNLNKSVVVNDVYYFLEDKKLWRSDGTTEGTYVLADFTLKIPEDPILKIINIGNILYLSTFTKLWKFELIPKTKLEHFHQISNNLNFIQRKLLNANATVYSVCADASESSIFKFSGGNYNYLNLKVELLGNPDNNRTEGHLYGQITVLSNTADSLVVRYKHPSHFSGSAESIVGGFFLKNSITGNVIQQYALNIYRPPVLIATGWFTDKPSASTFENELFSSSLYSFNASSFVHRVVYENATYLPIITNKEAIPNTINSAILALMNKKIAAGKVDLIAHSDGGILGRLYLQDDNYRQDIHKLITINTPHGGSHKANFWSLSPLQDLYCNSPLDPKKCDKGLIKDLSVNSEFINYTLNGSKKNNHISPSHAIATTVFETELALTEPPSYMEWQNCTKTIAGASLVGPAGSIAGLYLCAGGFLAGRLKDAVPNIILDLSNSAIFQSPFNDQFVSLSSQLGGLQDYSTTQISNQVHETSLANQNVFQRVLELIKSDINSNDFSITGFNPPFLSYLAPINSKINSLPSSKLKINRPIMSSRYYKGRLLDIDIIGSDIAEMKIIVGYKSDSVYIINGTSANTNFKFPLDTILGERKMIVIAKTNDGSYIQDSTSFWITDNICEQTDLNSYMYLTGSPSSGTFSFNKIASNAKIEAIKDVTFKSTGFTLLMPGFESKNQSIFKVESQPVCPQIGAILWDKKWGTGNSQGYSIDVSIDSRNYFVGSDFFNGCPTPNKNGQIQKLDLNGNQVWTYCMSRLAGGASQAIKTTSDGGCIFTEINSSCGLIKKLNNSGGISWQKCIPNSNYFSVNPTNDGSYIIGYKNYMNSVSPSSSILKIDNLGNIIWQKDFSDTTLIPIAPIIIPTQDGGYYVAKSVNTRRDETGFDLDIIKLDAMGTLIWKKEFDWGINDFVREVRETNDQGVILVGGIEPDSASINGYTGNSDAFLLKLSKTGNTEWLKCFGWAGRDEGKTIAVQNDGYLLGGYSNDGIPNDLNCSYNSIKSGSWIMKIDNSGNKVWQKCIQAAGKSEIINSMKITNDSGLILTGSTGVGVWVKKISISN